MRNVRESVSVGVLCLILGICVSRPAYADVDLEFRPAIQGVGVGNIVEVGVYAVSSNAFDQPVEGLEIIIIWTPSLLKFVGHVDPCDDSDSCFVCPPNQYNWGISTFPSDCVADSINAPCPGGPLVNNDGNGWYQAFTQLECNGEQADRPIATPEGLHITTFRFEALAEGNATVSILAQWPNGITTTRVFGGSIPGTEVTGALGAPADIIVSNCVEPFVEAVGPRYFAITPPAGTAPVGIRVQGIPSDIETGCLDVYVQSDGNVDTVPFFQTPADWGTILMADEEIWAKRSYRFQTDCGPATSPRLNLSSEVTEKLWKWGDVNNNGEADFLDITILVDAFRNLSGPEVELSNVDIAICDPDEQVDFRDILQGVNAFRNIAQSCVAPCP